MRPALVLLLFGSVIPGSAQYEVFSEMKDDRIFIQSRILPESAFNLPNMAGVARQFLGDVGATRVLSKLSIYSRQDVAAAEKGVACEGSYLQWRVHYDAFPKGALMAADVISIGENSVLRLKARDGTVIRQVLRGQDPTHIQVDGVAFEILFVAGRIRSRFEGCGVPGTIEPVLFLKTKTQLSPEISRRVTSWLTAALGINNLWTDLRNDEWFLCSQFPVMFPFSSTEMPPSETAYYGTSEYGCSISCDGVVRCIGPGISPPSSRRLGKGR